MVLDSQKFFIQFSTTDRQVLILSYMTHSAFSVVTFLIFFQFEVD